VTRTRRRRDAGFVSHYLVLAFAVAIAASVLASETTVTPFYKEQQHLRFKEEALALAEVGLTVAESDLARGGTFHGLDAVPFAHGHVSVSVASAPGGELVLVATGTTSATALTGPGGTISRRVRARLRPSADGPPVVLDWKEL
jgi:hypothetical protein